jgi:hypothetical protein
MMEAVEDAIFNNAPPPWPLVQYSYRKIFHLSAQQLEEEPVDQFAMNMFIEKQIAKKQELEAKHG